MRIENLGVITKRVRHICCVMCIFPKLLLILEVFNTVSKAGSYIRELLLTHETRCRIPFTLS